MKKQPAVSAEYEHVTHTFGPVYDVDSKILILGSMPSVKSRSSSFIMGIRRTGSGKFSRQSLGKQCRRRSRKREIFC